MDSFEKKKTGINTKTLVFKYKVHFVSSNDYENTCFQVQRTFCIK